MQRRKFLGGVLTAGCLLAVPAAWGLEEPTGERMLVLLHLVGGNDGLNTVVPYRDSRYARLRPTIGLSANEVVPLDSQLALHAGLAPLRAHPMAVIPGVGYDEPSLSHFRSTEIWATASQQQSTAGWLGRWLEQQPERPFRAVALGNRIPLALVGRNFVPLTVGPFERFALPGILADVPAMYRPVPGSPMLETVIRSGAEAVQTASRLARLQTPQEPAGDGLAADLRRVLALMEAGLGVQVFHLAMDGFDTHVRQRASHDALLQTLGGTLAAFQSGLQARGLAERTLTVVFSEFGRRVEENSEAGTDHGTAGPVFLLGPRVRPGVLGPAPSLADLDDGNLRHNVDFRAVYATILRDWLGASSDPIVGPARPFDCLSV